MCIGEEGCHLLSNEDLLEREMEKPTDGIGPVLGTTWSVTLSHASEIKNHGGTVLMNEHWHNGN